MIEEIVRAIEKIEIPKNQYHIKSLPGIKHKFYISRSHDGESQFPHVCNILCLVLTI